MSTLEFDRISVKARYTAYYILPDKKSFSTIKFSHKIITYVRTSICYMYEVLLTYCYSTKNLRNDAFACFMSFNIKD